MSGSEEPVIIGTSSEMARVKKFAEVAALNGDSVLITGERGVGKELISGLIASKHGTVYKTCNVAAINPNLMESELFGHVQGAFTGAIKDSKGLFASAANGTVLLDEVGEMPLPVQSRLLRVIEEKVFSPVGSWNDKKLEAKIICATNRDLKKMVRAGKFRADLYDRLRVLPIAIPPLRKRIEDLELLAEYFFENKVREYGKDGMRLRKGVVDGLQGYNWPGNVRELKNSITAAIVNALVNGENEVGIRHFNLNGLEYNDSALLKDDLIEVKTFKELSNLCECIMLTNLLKIGHTHSSAADVIGKNKKTVSLKMRELKFKTSVKKLKPEETLRDHCKIKIFNYDGTTKTIMIKGM